MAVFNGKLAVIGAVVVAAGVAIGAAMWFRTGSAEPISGTDAGSDSFSGLVKAGGRTMASIGASSLAEGGIDSLQVPASQLAASDPRLVALSKAELAWLEKHYYPTQAELDALDRMDLKELARSADPKSRMLYGIALLRRDQVPGAMPALKNAATLGAFYAYEEAAAAEYAMLTKRGMDAQTVQDMLRAKVEVAKILGDHRAEYLLGRNLPSGSVANPAAVQQYTTEFLRQLGMNAQLMGVSASGPDPRPNADLWSDVTKLGNSGSADEQIDVYSRK